MVVLEHSKEQMLPDAPAALNQLLGELHGPAGEVERWQELGCAVESHLAELEEDLDFMRRERDMLVETHGLSADRAKLELLGELEAEHKALEERREAEHQADVDQLQVRLKLAAQLHSPCRAHRRTTDCSLLP